MNKQHLELRLKNIDTNINNCIERIQSYEELLIDEDDPSRQSKYQHNIKKQKELIQKYGKEYNETRKELEIKEAESIINFNIVDNLNENEVKFALGEIRKILTGPTAPEELRQILSNTSLDSRHILKLSIPIIPLILNYETEVAIGSATNLWNLWGWLKTKLVN